MNRPTTTKLQERRRQVANYVHKGWPQVAIARHMNIPQAIGRFAVSAGSRTVRRPAS